MKRTFQEILSDAGYEPHAYSGRGMFGETCLAVDIDGEMGSLFADILEEVDAEENDVAAHAFRRMRTDSLGLGTVVYFPGEEFVS